MVVVHGNKNPDVLEPQRHLWVLSISATLVLTGPKGEFGAQSHNLEGETIKIIWPKIIMGSKLFYMFLTPQIKYFHKEIK